MPEVLNFHRSLTNHDHQFGLNDLPMPHYMEEGSLNFGKNLTNKGSCCRMRDDISLSRHERLFGPKKVHKHFYMNLL